MGVLIASVIGLIVMYGLNRSLSHMFSQVDRVKKENRRELLFNTISSLLRNEVKCAKTFRHYLNSIVEVNTFTFSKIIGAPINLNNPVVQKKYNLKLGDSFNYMEARCGNGTCVAYPDNDVGTRAWTVRLYTQYGNSVQYDDITTIQITIDDTTGNEDLTCVI